MRVSVITVCLNNASTIRATLESVRTQRCPFEVEHIIIDGNSTDGTLSIIRKFMEEPTDVKVMMESESDAGLYYAMNKGLQLSTGSYVGFLNADDIYADSGSLSRLIAAASRGDASSADVIYIKEGKRCRYYSGASFHRRKMLMGIMPAHPTFYCKTEILRAAGGFDTNLRIASDFELLFRLIYKRGIKVEYTPGVEVKMCAGGITGRGVKSHFGIMCDHFRTYLKHRAYLGIICDMLRYPGKLVELIKK